MRASGHSAEAMKTESIHRMIGLTQVDDFALRECDHINALVGAASPMAQPLIQIRSVFSRRYPHLRSVLLGVQRRRPGDLAHIADRVLVGGGIPVECLPI